MTPDGRTLAYLEAGDPGGPVILHRAFDVRQIDRPVHMWQGLDDRLVPDPINEAVADAMPGAVSHPVEGAGHFVAIGSGEKIFGIAAKELGAP